MGFLEGLGEQTHAGNGHRLTGIKAGLGSNWENGLRQLE